MRAAILLDDGVGDTLDGCLPEASFPSSVSTSAWARHAYRAAMARPMPRKAPVTMAALVGPGVMGRSP